MKPINNTILNILPPLFVSYYLSNEKSDDTYLGRLSLEFLSRKKKNSEWKTTNWDIDKIGKARKLIISTANQERRVFYIRVQSSNNSIQFKYTQCICNSTHDTTGPFIYNIFEIQPNNVLELELVPNIPSGVSSITISISLDKSTSNWMPFHKKSITVMDQYYETTPVGIEQNSVDNINSKLIKHVHMRINDNQDNMIIYE